MQKDQIKQINKHFLESCKVMGLTLVKLRRPILEAANLIQQTFESGGKLLICGNGGSAAEAQHLSSDFVGRYLKDRRAVNAMSLTTDTSSLTSIGNDYGFDRVFARQIEAYANKGDLLLCISTSGKSTNIISAAKLAKLMHVKIISLSGKGGGKLKSLSDVNLIVPSDHTPYIQETHLVIIHALCDLIEPSLSPQLPLLRKSFPFLR